MIKEDYVPMDIAEDLQKKRFLAQDKIRKAYRKSDGALINSDGNFDYDKEVPCPTVQMTIKWLYEEHNLFLTVTPDINDHLCCYAEVYRKYIDPEGFDSTWEEVFLPDLDASLNQCEQFWGGPEEAWLYLIRLCLKHLV